MCVSGYMTVAGKRREVYLGYYGNMFDGIKVNEDIRNWDEIKGILSQATKEELIEAILELLETAEE